MENRESIFALATELGKALKADPALIRLEEAKNAYESDPDLKRKMVEYEVQEKAMQNEVAKPDRDTHFIEIIQNRINVLYREIADHPTFAALNAAQKAAKEASVPKTEENPAEKKEEKKPGNEWIDSGEVMKTLHISSRTWSSWRKAGRSTTRR